MTTFNTRKTSTGAVLIVAGIALSALGCGFGESGIAPPSDRVFFPAGLAVDPGGKWLYVVNSNSDLRFNAGTVVAIDLDKVAADRADRAKWTRCPNSVFVEPQKGDPHFCCRDFVDGNVLNCDERAYVAADATVRIGSFGGTILVQEIPGQPARRLFVAVRAEPSLTFVDVNTTGDRISMRCASDSEGPNAFCTDDFRIKGMTVQAADGTPTEIPFPEEPHPMVLDDALQVLYVGHLGGVDRGKLVARGVSVIDVCDPAAHRPVLASVLDDALPGSGAIGVTSLTPAPRGDPEAPIYATAELTSEIAQLLFLHPDAVACGAGGRDLRLVAGRRFHSSAYGTTGADLRGFVVDDAQERAFVLHHQYAVRGEFNPPSVVAIDLRPGVSGLPTHQPTGIVEVCNGPNRLLSHDAGRGMRLYVNCFENGQIYVLEPNLLNVEAVIEVGTGPAELVFAPNDPTLAFVAGFANNNLTVVDLKPGSPTENRVIQRIGFARPSAVPK